MKHRRTYPFLGYLPEHIQNHIDAEGDCWEWSAVIDSWGYGITGYQGRKWVAHRLVYSLLVGEVPGALDVDHLCRNTRCVNPDHLEPVTQSVNTLRSPRRGGGERFNGIKTHCHLGHPFDEANTYIYKGRRQCRRCRADATNRYERRILV